MARNKRKSRLINSTVQRALLFQFISHWASFAVIVILITGFLQIVFAIPNEATDSVIGDMKNRYGLAMWVMLALVPYFVLDLIKLSHRFVGPIVRLGNALDRAARGEHVNPIHFRDGDFWHELAANFNQVMERLPNSEQQIVVESSSQPDAESGLVESTNDDPELVPTA